jgi:5-methylcytosine-specific restriction endonuclease McrA
MKPELNPDKRIERRERLWHAAQGLCHWCHKPTRLIQSKVPDQATIDHIIPRGRGGSDNEDNVVLACHGCNEHRNVLDCHSPGHSSHEFKRFRHRKQKVIRESLTDLHRQIKAANEQVRTRGIEIEALQERVKGMEFDLGVAEATVKEWQELYAGEKQRHANARQELDLARARHIVVVGAYTHMSLLDHLRGWWKHFHRG